MNRNGFLKSRLDSFKYAISGLKDILTTEHNAWIHAACTVAVLSLCVWLEIDIVSDQYSQAARRAKDMAAAAVLIATMGAFVTGLILLVPPLLIKLGL